MGRMGLKVPLPATHMQDFDRVSADGTRQSAALGVTRCSYGGALPCRQPTSDASPPSSCGTQAAS